MHVGYVDTDMAAEMKVDKVAPEEVATVTCDGLVACRVDYRGTIGVRVTSGGSLGRCEFR